MASPITAFNEVRITEDGISISLYTESSEGVRVEDERLFTFDEMEDMSGEVLMLKMSEDSRDELSEQRTGANIGRVLMAGDSLEDRADELSENPEAEELLAYMGFYDDREDVGEPTYPEPGEIVVDQNPPEWSEGNELEVVEVLSDVTAEEYVVQGQNSDTTIDAALQSWDDKTVADANPSYSSDEPVIIAEYIDGNGTEYAFPASRLEAEY